MTPRSNHWIETLHRGPARPGRVVLFMCRRALNRISNVYENLNLPAQLRFVE